MVASSEILASVLHDIRRPDGSGHAGRNANVRAIGGHYGYSHTAPLAASTRDRNG
jgi:hypothetical protein